MIESKLSTKVGVIEKERGEKIAVVEVSGPKFIPNQTRELRARGRALLDTGVVSSSVSTVGDIAMGDVKRLTEVHSPPEVMTEGNFFIRERWRIKVNGS